MSLTITQIIASSYPAVVTAMRKPENQWAESAFLRELERQKAIDSRNLGPTIEAPFDWRRNATAAILATDFDTASITTKTDVIGTASYAVAQLSVWVNWSKGDDAKNPTENQKVNLVKSLLSNGINSHDDLVEATLFTTSTAGGDELIGLDTMLLSTGLGTIGGVNASTDAFWRNQADTFSNGDDMEAAMTSMFNKCAKGSGSSLQPTLLVSDGATQALFESTQQAFQRYVDSDDLKAGFKTIAFKSARYVYSQYGGPRVYFLNNKSYQVITSKEYFRAKGETSEVQTANGFTFKIYSALQAITNNRSRLGVLTQA